MSLVYFDASATKAYTLRVSNVALSATTLGASVTLVSDVAGVTNNASLDPVVPAAGDQIFQRGSFDVEDGSGTCTASGLGPVSLSTLSGGGSVYGISQGNCESIGFIGNAFTSVGDASQEAFLLRMKRVHQKSGDMPDLICVSPMVAAVLGFSAITPATAGGLTGAGESRRAVDGKLDKYGRDIMSDSGIALGGKRVLEDVNLNDETAYLINREFCKIALWQDIAAEKQGGDTLLVQQTAFAKVAFFNAAFNVMATKRSAIGKLSGLTVTL
jgi:hypothetical protein